MKDLIIGTSTNYDWDKLKYWVNSINQSGFEGDKVLILLNCDKETVKKVSLAGFTIVGAMQDAEGNLVYNSPIPVHVERFLHMHNFLKTRDYRYIITTDVKDVVFQKNPVEYLEKVLNEDKDYVFASESMKYKDEPWGDQNLFETYGNYIYDNWKNNEIYNVGVLGGHGDAMRDLFISIFAAALSRPIKICDQSTFNFMISTAPFRKCSVYLKSEDAWAAQLGTTADPSKIEQFRPNLLEPSPKLVGNEVTTSTGIPFTIVHQYDRVPEWRKLLEEKYA
jgi:hypothetical protein